MVVYNKFQNTVETMTALEMGFLWGLSKDKAIDVDLLINRQLDERKHLLAASKGATLSLKKKRSIV